MTGFYTKHNIGLKWVNPVLKVPQLSTSHYYTGLEDVTYQSELCSSGSFYESLSNIWEILLEQCGWNNDGRIKCVKDPFPESIQELIVNETLNTDKSLTVSKSIMIERLLKCFNACYKISCYIFLIHPRCYLNIHMKNLSTWL